MLHISSRAIPILHSSTRRRTMTTTTGNTSSSTSTSHSQSHSRTTTGSDRYRSTPITIARPGDEGRLNKQEIGDSSDDDDIGNDPNTTENMLNQGISGLSLGYVGSVPTRTSGIRRRKPDHNNNNTQLQSSSLPAAPLLVSKGSDGRDRHQPPPMRLTENTDSTLQLTYGSLRESHIEGKFLDGPSSYRDRSGQIHELRHNQKVHLDASATSYHLPFLLPPQNSGPAWKATDLSLGDRIMAGASTSNNNKSPTTSSLSSLMQSISPPLPLSAAVATSSSTTSTMIMDHHVIPQHNSQRYHDRSDDAETSVLSTSLTALEVLQAARHRSELLGCQDQHSGGGPRSMPSTLPHPSQQRGHDHHNNNNEPPVAIPHFLSHDDDDENHDVFELDME